MEGTLFRVPMNEIGQAYAVRKNNRSTQLRERILAGGPADEGLIACPNCRQ